MRRTQQNQDFSAPSGFGTPSKTFNSLMDDDTDSGWTKPRVDEAAITAKVDASLAAKKKAMELFGTDDPMKIAAITAAGGLDEGDIAKRMQVDPAGTRAQVERVIALSGKGGVQDVPDGPPRQFSAGTGAGGEPYFTNLSRDELKQEKHTADTIRGSAGKPSVTDLKTFTPGTTGGVSSGSEGAVKEQSIAETLFQGRIDQARAIVTKPDRDEKRAVSVQKYFNEVFDSSPDIRTARQKVEDDLLSGEFKKRGLLLPDVKFVDATLLKRGKTTRELGHTGIDRLFFKPWVRAGDKPGEASDLAEPSTVLNPGGSASETTKVQQDNLLATNEHANALETFLPSEQPTMLQYARGEAAKKVKKQAGTPQVARGGKAGGLLSDIHGFLEGEGRAGYGESGATGVAKDLTAFYGPRLPGDILTAIGGVGLGKMARKGAKEAMKLRAIDNIFTSY